MGHPVRAALLATTCVAATTAHAQDDGVFLGTLRIEAAQAQAVLGNDQITEDEIERRNPKTTKDVFVGESSISASGGAAIAQKVFVNGIEESLLSVTIDGARQNKSAFHHTGNILLDPALLKSVEVSKGIAPADAGPGAVGGGLAYTTKDARDLLDGDEAFGGRVGLTFGDNGLGTRGTLTVFGQQAGFEWLLSATRHEGDDYEDGDGDTVQGTAADVTDYIGKFAYTGPGGGRLSFAASETTDTGARAAQAGPGGILFTRPDFAGVVGRDSVLTDALSRRTSYTLSYVDEQPDTWFAPSLQLSYNEQEIDASGVEGTNTSLSGFAKNEFALANGTLTAGLDFFKETAEGQGNGPGPFASSGEEELTNVGVFAQARQDIGDHVSLSYGARYDWQTFTDATGEEHDDSGFSANGAIDYMLTDTLTLNAGIASTWGGYELGEAALINFGGAWNYDGIKPSTARSARLGLRWEDGPWSASGALFRTEVEDIAAVLPSGGARGALTDLSSQGFELSVAYTGTRGFAAMNFTKADVELDDETIGSTAYYLGRPVGSVLALEAGYDINDVWSVGGNAEIAFENDDAAVTLPGYEVVNAFATYTPRQMDGLEVRLDVRNLFDATYESRSSDGIDSSRVIALTEPGRTISLTASFEF